METFRLETPKRRFAGRSPAAAPSADMQALGDVLLSARPAADVPSRPVEDLAVPSPCKGEGVAESAGEPSRPVPAAPPGRLLPAAAPGLSVVILSGLAPSDRRRAALAVAGCLSPRGCTTAVLVFENERVDGHILGEPGCGRLGPQSYLGSGDVGLAVTDLVQLSDRLVAAALDDPATAVRLLEPLAPRTVFVAAHDLESLLETYRSLKSWKALAPGGQAALFVVGAAGADEAGRLHRRLSRAARQFLGIDLASQGFLTGLDGAASRPDHPEPLRILAQAPAEEVWPRLLSAARKTVQSGGPRSVVAAPAPQRQDATERVPPETSNACPAFSIWTPEDRESLLAAVEAQGGALLTDTLQHIFRVEVDEPGAPPLAAVRADGTLVAILVAGPGELVDASAASRWLKVHRRVLARAYPCSGIRVDADPSAIVLAPVEAPAVADGIRRFLPLRLGAHRGIVILP